MAEPPQKPKRRIRLIAWMLVSQILAAGSLMIWAVMAGLSVMAFDSGESPEAWAFVSAVWAYPLIPLALVIAAWVAFANRKNILAAVLSGLSFAPPVLFYVFLWVATLVGP